MRADRFHRWWNYGITRDANGNQIGATENGAAVKGYLYTAQNQAWSVWNGASQATASHRTRWFYGADGARYKRVDDGTANTARTIYCLGGVELIASGGVWTWRRPLAGGQIQTFTGYTPVAQHRSTQLHDHIGSIVVIADEAGNFVENADHGAFGNRRGWVGALQLGQINLAVTERGFTGHEQVENLSTIHMNGSIYDPVQARFLQADPLVQDAYNPQNWNPFAYVYNNPLANTDPTGMFSIRSFLNNLSSVLQVASVIFPALQPLAVAVAGIAHAVNTAAAFRHGGMQQGLLAAFSPSFNSSNPVLNVLGNAASAGLQSKLAGGTFREGARRSLATAAAMFAITHIAQGVRSAQTGNKFINGADTRAFELAAGDTNQRPSFSDLSDAEVAGYAKMYGLTAGELRTAVGVGNWAVSKYQPLSNISRGREYGGLVFRDTAGAILATQAVWSDGGAVNPFNAMKFVPEGAVVIFDYHTHGTPPLGKRSDFFSSHDVWGINATRIRRQSAYAGGILGTSTGSYLYFAGTLHASRYSISAIDKIQLRIGSIPQ